MRAYSDFVWRWRRALLFAAALVMAGAVALASRLELRTNFAELLPSRDPAVAELEKLSKRVGGTAILQIAVESPDRDANLRFAASLTAELKKLPRDVLDSAAYDVRDEQRFFRERRWLYAPLDDLIALRDALRDEIARRKNPLLENLVGDSPRDVLDRIRARAGALDRFPTGYFEGEGGHLVAIVCRPPGGLFAERAGERLLGEARRLIAQARPPANMTVRLTGDVMAQLEERHALESDLAWATAVCVTLVALVVVLFYGRLRALPMVALPALIGVAVAFGAAELLFGYLNASTAFLGSIVVGNGINFPIITLARYEEARRSGEAPRAACETALSATLRPTLVAAFGAAISYGSLITTRFRGFSQFGAIGGIGMIAAWLATVTLLPALWATFDRRPAGALGRRLPEPRVRFSDVAARVASRAPRACLALFAVLTVASIVPLKHYLRDPFEYDFRNLRNRRSIESGAESIAPRVDRIFGLTLTPSVIVADRREQAAEIREVVLARDRASGAPLLGDVTTLDSFLPGDLATQQKKLDVLGDLRALIDSRDLEFADDEDRAELRCERPPESLDVVHDHDLPVAIRRPFTETDGTLGRVVLVYHGANVSVWDGRNLLRIAELIAEVPLAGGAVVRSSGHAVVFSAMIRSIAHDAPRATAVSLAGVALLVLLLARGRGAWLVLAALAGGVLWMLGAAAWLGVRTNFLNFIALPITFGIGVDYGINIVLRCNIEGRDADAVLRAVRRAGGAVALCSLTTIIGYAALLVADNLALRSFGAMAILGEIACLAAAVLGLPAFLLWWRRRK
jgi:predicted RND superfamily exporter protein